MLMKLCGRSCLLSLLLIEVVRSLLAAARSLLPAAPPYHTWCHWSQRIGLPRQRQLSVLKPGMGKAKRQRATAKGEQAAIWRRGCRGLLRTWPSCRGTCSAEAGSSKWCGLVPRPDPPRTWLRTSHHPLSCSPRGNRQVLQGERRQEAVSEGPHPPEPGRQLPGRRQHPAGPRREED